MPAYLQYVHQYDAEHHLQIVQVFVAVEHPAELLRVLDIERHLQILLFRPANEGKKGRTWLAQGVGKPGKGGGTLTLPAGETSRTRTPSRIGW